MFLALPQPTVPGEVVPPIPCEFGVGLTDKDAKGHRWAILQATDGTVSASFRIPWQLAAQVGAQLANGLAAMQQKAASEENGGLVVPGKPAGGGLFIPGPGQRTPGPIPPLNGSAR
jgi:hypothetical protein